MATKKRRRRKSAAHTSTRRKVARKRRRRTAVVLANPATRKRRRRHAVAASKPRRRSRRRYSLNPSLGGIQRTVVEGMKDGATVFVAQVATRKASQAINGMIPASVLTGSDTSGVARGVVTRLAGAVAVTMIARKVSPARARLAAAGAFAEVVNFAVSQSPTATKFLSAFPSRRVIARGPALNAWARPQAIAAGARTMSAYPMRSVGMPMNVGV